MALSTADFTVNPQITAVLLDAISNASGFQSASKQVTLNGNGGIVSSIEGTDASFVGEGEKKPAKSTTVKEVTIIAKKLAKIVSYTDEVASDIAGLEALIKQEALTSIGRTFDKAASGNIVAPSGFDQLSAATKTVTITNHSTWTQALAPVKSGVGRSSFVINEAMFYALMGLTNVQGGVLLNIVPSSETSGVINGVPYFIYTSNKDTAEGFVGPFSEKAMWGVIPNSFRIDFDLTSYEDEEGNQVHLAQQNKKAVLVEARVGFKVMDLSLFRKVAVEAPVED